MTAGLRPSVLEALDEVHDPELDEPITSLGFVTSCEVSPDGDVDVVLQLPTPQCAPNFAFLMAADARRVVRRLPDVREVTIRLQDHYTGQEINAALARGDGFAGAFPGETADDDLTSLRELFLRKALVGRQSRLCETMLGAGRTPPEIAALRVADLPDVPDAQRCLELRRHLGLPHEPEAQAKSTRRPRAPQSTASSVVNGVGMIGTTPLICKSRRFVMPVSSPISAPPKRAFFLRKP